MLRVATLLLSCALINCAHADEVRVAVASNFMAPMKALVANFERATGHQVQASYGATGKFYAQIHHGAPFDVLLAADAATPAKLEQEGAAVAGSRFTYATGRLVLWSASPGVVDDKGNVLAKGGYRHLAIANPKLAPYGAAAVEVLTKLGLYASVVSKFVQGENIAQTHQFVASGAATLGLVAMSQVTENGKLTGGSAWLVPASMHTPIRQDAVVLAKGKGKGAVGQFIAYLQSAPAKALIRSYGYDL